MAKRLSRLLGLAVLCACAGTADQGPTSGTVPPARTPEAPTPAATDAGFASEILEAHNRWRRKYGVPDLTWSPQLAAFAQEWAEELSPRGLNLEHRPNNPYGENLYAVQGRRATPRAVVDAWGSEERFFDPEKNNWWPDAAHFSQMIWYSTRQVGCAVSRSRDTEHWVCNYDPPGNVRGRRPF